MYRGDLSDEEQRLETLRADIAALETKISSARGVADRLAVEERRSLRRKLRPLVRWWGLLLLLFAFAIGAMIGFGRGEKPQRDPCFYLKGTPITVPAW